MSVFVDTGPWYAGVVPDDPEHARALAWHRQNQQPLVTSDYIIDETLTLLRARGEHQRAIALGRQLLDLGGVHLHRITAAEFQRAWELFRSHPDRDWSFTDCATRVVIEVLHIKEVLTFDHHFEELGGVKVVP